MNDAENPPCNSPSNSSFKTPEPARRVGKVWLVGAGPGDPGLITVKGARCIARADVIIYDHLANPALLAGSRPDCERIFAGKQAGRHSMKQDEINRLIVEKAREGKHVCRLKGGDPFLFGRGGEEALYLREHGVPFEVVPGVTSAIAAPAYAGIPVTHRHFASSFRVITGHEDLTKPESDLDWREIAATRGTLVFLMGVRNLRTIVERLVAGGCAPPTPAALIANGTRPSQRTVVGTLADIAERAEEQFITPPALLVVGQVVLLRDALEWFERKPIIGRTIVVTRARAQASEFAMTLEELGAEVIQAPTIQIESLAHTPAMRSAVHDVAGFRWLVFTSVNGVDAFLEAMRLEQVDVGALAGVRIAAIGPATVQRLCECGLQVELMPGQYETAALLATLDSHDRLEGQAFLVPRPEVAPRTLVDGLRRRGASVTEVTAYRTVRGEALSAELIAKLERDEIDLVTFTSSSTARNFVEALPEERRAELLRHVRAASIGPVTSTTLQELGVPIALTSAESTIAGLTAAILEYFEKTARR